MYERYIQEAKARTDERLKALQIRPPSWLRQLLERRFNLIITPNELSSARGDLTQEELLNQLRAIDPYLFGDKGAIGPGDDGRCQSWVGYPGWWVDCVSPELSSQEFALPSILLRLVAGKGVS